MVELDGWEHHRGREAFERDRRKLAELRARGREAVAITYRQATSEPRWVAELVAGLRRRRLAGRS